jgi:hypothetical protein
MRSKNEVLCAAAGRLAAERSEADKPGKYTIIWLHLDVVTPIITREYPSYRVFRE